MKIAILYDSKYGNTKQLAEFLAEQIRSSNYEVQLFRTTKTKPKQIMAFEPQAILVGGPTHFGQPARTLKKYIEKLGKINQTSLITKIAIFNCYTGDIVCKIIQEQILAVLPEVKILEKTLPIKTGNETGENWKEVKLEEGWQDKANDFIVEFLKFTT